MKVVSFTTTTTTTNPAINVFVIFGRTALLKNPIFSMRRNLVNVAILALAILPPRVTV